MTLNIDTQLGDTLLSALAEQLGAQGESYELLVVGGSALITLGLVSRTTVDVDVIGVRGDAGFVPADPLPEPLRLARDRVARDFSIDPEWLNARAADIVRFGLPEGFEDRVETRPYPPSLMVHFASRYDLIHFKLHALVDRGPGGKHEDDLRALEPTREELLAAARWAMTHDPSEGFRQELEHALRYLGVEDADLDA
jgi:Nucleotidyltransferase of unknown function (DUF6036)